VTSEEKAALRQQFPTHYFLRVLALGHQCVIALPRKQSTPEKEAAVELWHGATVMLGDTRPIKS
jgi:hypothetical protein